MFIIIVLFITWLIIQAMKKVYSDCMNSLEEWLFNLFNFKSKIRKVIESARNKANSINQ
jgi:hypothetical protein